MDRAAAWAAAGGVFGGSTGPLRLLNSALGGQAGWFLGFAVVAGGRAAVSTRLRRDDARTGWLIAVGAAFAVTAITFSRASGIFHPYYVAALAPFTALLVGGGYSLLTRRAGPLILLGGAVTEAIVIGTSATDLEWARWLIVGATAAAALGLVLVSSQRVRRIVATAGVAVLLLAPGVLGGADARPRDELDVPGGRPDVRAVDGRRPGGGGGGGFRGGTPPAGAPSAASTGGPGAGGGMFGGDTLVGHLRPDIHQGQRRRHARDLEPVRRRVLDHRLGRRRRRARRVLRQRDDRLDRLAGGHGRARARSAGSSSPPPATRG